MFIVTGKMFLDTGKSTATIFTKTIYKTNVSRQTHPKYFHNMSIQYKNTFIMSFFLKIIIISYANCGEFSSQLCFIFILPSVSEKWSLAFDIELEDKHYNWVRHPVMSWWLKWGFNALYFLWQSEVCWKGGEEVEKPKKRWRAAKKRRNCVRSRHQAWSVDAF